MSFDIDNIPSAGGATGSSAESSGRSVGFTYWREPDGMWLGYMDDYPEYTTEGYTLDDLKRMLLSLRRDIASGEVPGVRRHSALELA